MPKIEQLALTAPTNLKEAIGKINSEDPTPLVTELKDGILGFAEAMFGRIDRDQIYAQKFLRDAKGRGAHFDVYNNFINETHPAIGVYNLTGHALLRAFVLRRKLQEYYDETYPEPTDAAFEARREISSLALSEAGITVMEARIRPGVGMVFPQFRDGRHLVHEVVPMRPGTTDRLPSFETSQGGSFIKLVVPKNGETANIDFRSRGYTPLSQFIEEQLSGVSYEERDRITPVPKEPSAPPLRRGTFSRPAVAKRSCNFD